MRSALAALIVCAPVLAHAEDEAPPLSIYGFARLDLLANDSRMSSLDEATFVEREPAAGQIDGAMTMTPRLSRVGLSIDQWELTDNVFRGEGRVEIDFGGGDGTNAIRLRQAYGSIKAKRQFELLIGQTSDLVSPLYPAAQNDTQLRDAGNLGDRRPQLRLVYTPNRSVLIAVAAATTNPGSARPLDGDGVSDVMPSTMPMLQWLAEGRFDDKGVRFGLSGHAATDELPNGDRVGSNSVAAHAYVPIGRKLVVLGEGYVGKNLAELGGGIGQGVNMTTGEAIRSSGGWLECALLPTPRHLLAFGTSIDKVVTKDIEMGDRERNSTVYSVLRYKPKPALQLGLEYLHWRTQYKDMTDGRANRFDAHFSVFF